MSTSVHDIIMVPDELVWQALTAANGGRQLLWQCTRREQWVDGPLDHAVTRGYCFVGTMKTGAVKKADLASTMTKVERAPRRYHPSPNLWLKRMELNLVCGEMDDAVAAELARAGRPSTIDEKAAIVTRAALAAQQAGRQYSAQSELESDTMTVRRARKERHECLVEFEQAIRDRAKRPADRTTAQKRRVKLANRAYQQANRMLQQVLKTQDATRLLMAHKRKPKRFWSKAKLLASDPGAAHAEASSSFLLDHQNDETGQRTSSDLEQNKQNMRQNRQTTYQMKSEAKLSDACVAAINAALVELHVESKRTIAAYPRMAGHDSAICSAVDARSPMVDADNRRQIHRDLDEAIEEFEQTYNNRKSKCQSIRESFPEEVAQLQRDITMVELLAVCAKIRDVGPGVDGVAPIVLKFQAQGHTMDLVLSIFLDMQQQAVAPKDWRTHRNLFHYKGKNSDPYCLSNYRGLGIDQMLLKVFSLLMMERLELFLASTGALWPPGRLPTAARPN